VRAVQPDTPFPAAFDNIEAEMDAFKWSLPKCLTALIFAHLAVKDLAGVAAVCKHFNTIRQSKELIALLFERDLFLFTCYSSPSSTLNISYSSQCRLLKTLQRKNEEWLEYKGFATNGGVYMDNTCYSLRNSFRRNENPGYCTPSNARNVNIAGVLKDSEEINAEKEAKEIIKIRIRMARSKLDEESEHWKARLDNEGLVQMYGAAFLEQIAEYTPEVLLFEGEEEVDMQKSVREVLKCQLPKSPNLQ
jgi:hypothetical protein